MTKFNKIRKLLSTIPYINNGGCAYAAIAMYKICQSENIKCKVVFLYDNKYKRFYDYNEDYFNGKRKEPASCRHVAIKIGDKIYDCNKEINLKWSFYTNTHEIEDISIVETAIKRGQWNRNTYQRRTFDRKQYCPIINKYVDDVINEINESFITILKNKILNYFK